ncbi:MAG: hypothetical protein R3B52_01060 [Candidatus Paceibacterota bacterium]
MTKTEEKAVEMPSEKQSSKKWLFILIALIVVGALGYGYMTGMFDSAMSKPLNISLDEELSEEQVAEVIERVRDHITLPEGEDPLVATIINVEELRAEQAFYQNAENGDILLLFGQAGKAIIYSPSKDRLINVGPIQFDNTAPQEAEVPVSQ